MQDGEYTVNIPQQPSIYWQSQIYTDNNISWHISYKEHKTNYIIVQMKQVYIMRKEMGPHKSTDGYGTDF